jgi:trans-aconitate 2-methyltransferase
MSGQPARTWDAPTYHRVAAAMDGMGLAVLDRLELAGDETVLDAGCGTGRITSALVDRLPRGRVIGVDASAAMVARAREVLGDRAEIRQADLLELALDEPVDAVLSTATFHWVLDHDRLFARLFAALRPGGRLVAQCGGAGNIAGVLAAADEVAARPEYAASFGAWTRPHRFAGAEETAAKLAAAGFAEVRCWLAPNPVVPSEPLAYLATVTLGAHLDRLPAPRHAAFIAQVAALLDEPITIDYVRLNIDATRPA